MLALFFARFLMGCGGTDGGVKGDIAKVIPSRARLDVAAAFAFRTCARAPPTAPARDLIQRVGELARRKFLLSRVYFLPAIPPMRIAGVENLLLARLGGLVLRVGFAGLLVVV